MFLKGEVIISDPPIVGMFFNSTRLSWLWLIVLLMLAWKVAGWYGLDRFLLPLIGTPGSGSLPNPHGCQKHTRLGRQRRVKKQLPASLKEGVRCNRAA